MTENHSNNNYNKNLKEYARKLRNNSTLAEVVLCDKVLKRKKLSSYSFLRQRPIGNYIVDFFSKYLKLNIEIDGEIHKFQRKKDKQRENDLKELGYSIIRLDNNEVLKALFDAERTLNEFIDDFKAKNNITPKSPQGEN